MPVRKIASVTGVAQPVTLEQAKQQCRITHDAEDAYIATLIDVATQAASDRLQRTLVPTRYRLTTDRFLPTLGLFLPPVTSVESVKYFDTAGTQQTLDPQDYMFDGVSEPAYLVPAPGHIWPIVQDRFNAVEVDYIAGYPAGTVPTPVVHWILLAVADLYDNRTRSADRPVVAQGFADALLDAYRIWSM